MGNIELPIIDVVSEKVLPVYSLEILAIFQFALSDVCADAERIFSSLPTIDFSGHEFNYLAQQHVVTISALARSLGSSFIPVASSSPSKRSVLLIT